MWRYGISVKREPLMIVPGVDAGEAAAALVALNDDAQVRTVMNRLQPGDAARIVASAPDVEAQTRLMWSMTKPQRAAVIDHLAPVAVAAMIQNQERRNRRLLGDISLDHFSQILAFCGPRQRYYWMSLANSIADVGAHLLVVLMPAEEIAEALLTVPEFRRKIHRLKRQIAGGFDEALPVEDARLRMVLIRLGEYDQDRYGEVLDEALAMLEGDRLHESITADMEREPGVLPRIPEVPPLRPGRAPVEAPADETGMESAFLPLAVPRASDHLMRIVAGALTPARRQSLEREMEKAFRSEVLADGGSVAAQDLERAAARLQAYVRLGLQGVPEDPDEMAGILESTPLHDIMQRGTTALEQLRQIALRLRPFEPVLDARQRDLVKALLRPQATVEQESGEPALMVPAQDRRRRAEAIPVVGIHEQLANASVWVAVARALGLRALTEKLAAAPNGSLAVLAGLGVSLVTYGRWDPEALENAVLRRFRDTHFDRARSVWSPGTDERIREAVQAWAESVRMDATMRPRVVARVLEAMAQLQEFLGRPGTVAWDRFAPGKRPTRRGVRISLDEAEAEVEDAAEEEA